MIEFQLLKMRYFHFLLHDILQHIRCARLLAHPPNVFYTTLRCDHEKANHAHDQAQIRSFFFWQAFLCWQGPRQG